MRRLLAIVSALFVSLSSFAQASDAKAAAMKHAIYILTIAEDRSGLDGPFYSFRGAVTGTQDSTEFIATKGIVAPEGVSRQLLFRRGKGWPAFAAELTPAGAQAMRAAITEVLPAEKPVGHFTARTQSAAAGETYTIVEGGIAIGSLSVRKSDGSGMLVIKPGY